MTDLTNLTLTETLDGLKNKQFSATEVTQSYIKSMEANRRLNAYVLETPEVALTQAKEADTRYAIGTNKALDGIPMGIKDLFCTKGIRTTACSHILDNFVPQYESTVTQNLLNAGISILGKLNMDEFAMGSTTETSYFGATSNPWDKDRVPGGSSGGSAACVAAALAPVSLGSDTGGSIRQPASFCGVTGLKPTYGSVSRYGLVAFASSLDQIGPIGRKAEDIAAVFNVISGKDQKDQSSLESEKIDLENIGNYSLEGKKFGIPEEYIGDGIDADVKKAVLDAVEVLKSKGATVETFSMPIIKYAIPTYYIICTAEACSNLSRYDGVKYGYRPEGVEDLGQLYIKSRSEGFGLEVKRRIMLGNFVLSSGYYDAYYNKALRVKNLIKQAFDEAFTKYDAILGPVAPTAALKKGESLSDPLKMYLGDICTVLVNIVGIPAMSVPCGFTSEGLPVGLQIMGDRFKEETVIGVANAYQKATSADGFENKIPEEALRGEG